MQREHAEDVVVEQPRFADLGAVEQFGDAGDEVARRRVRGRGRESRGLDPAGDAAEDAALGIGAGTARSHRLPFIQVEVLGAGVGQRGADVGRVDAGGGEGGHAPVAADAAAFFLIGLEPVGAAIGGVLGLGRCHVGGRAAGRGGQGREGEAQRGECAQGPSGGNALWRIHVANSFFKGGDARARTCRVSRPPSREANLLTTLDRIFGLGIVLLTTLPGPFCRPSGTTGQSSPIPLRVSPGFAPEFPAS